METPPLSQQYGGFKFFAKKWSKQCGLLLWKNYKLAIRNKSATITQLIAPAIFLLSLLVFQESIKSSSTIYGDLYFDVKTTEENSINQIRQPYPPLDIPSGVECCWTFIYSPNNSIDVRNIVEMIANDNNPPIPLTTIRGFATPEDMDLFLFHNMNTTQAGIIFELDIDNSTSIRNFAYTLQLNASTFYSHGKPVKKEEYVTIPLTYAIDKALLKYAIQGNTTSNVAVNQDVKIAHFPHDEMVSVDIIGVRGPLWFFTALIVNFVIGLGQIVQEKELKLRESMKIMGLYDSAYWMSWVITLTFYNTITVLEIIIFGCIMQFNFFLKNDFGLYFFALELFSMTLVSLAILISTLVKKSGGAVGLGFAMFFIGFFLQLFAGIVYRGNADKIIQWIFALVSPSILQLSLGALGDATAKSSFKGLRWADRSHPERTSYPMISFNAMYTWLIVDFVIYLLIGLYLDNVLKNEYGTSKPFYYFLTPSYWTGAQKKVTNKDFTERKYTNKKDLSEKDDDVLEEENAVLENKLDRKHTAVKLTNLCKAYDSTSICTKLCCCGRCAGQGEFVAVKDLSFAIKENSLFCLLGPNGAGKSTTIQMLIGFHPSTYGDAKVFGNSIRDNLSTIQSMLGVCHQFDILWDDLTGEEHLRLFGGMRNLSGQELNDEVERLIQEVSLEPERNLRTSSYSGGMRRRLSIAIALIGDPKLVILDEPTTGMDPVSRREVWNVIESAKKNRVILLTTHSMEEADILGDRIAIMRKGRMQCIGSALRLKQKFGAGYTITIGIGTQSKSDLETKNPIAVIQNFFEANLTGSKLSASSDPLSGYMSFSVPRESTKELIPFFNQLEINTPKLGIIDCQLSITTLEEVFMTIAEREAALSNETILVKSNEDLKGLDNDISSASDVELNTISDSGKFPQTQTNVKPKKVKLSLKNQFKALFIKNLKLQSRERKTNICQGATPPGFIIIVILFQLLITYLVNDPTIPENLSPSFEPSYHVLSKPPLFAKYIENNQTLPIDPTILYFSSMDVGNYTSSTGFLGDFEPPFGQPFNTKFPKFDDQKVINGDETLSGEISIPMPYYMEKKESKAEIEKTLYENQYTLPKYFAAFGFNQLDFINNVFQYSIWYNHSLTSAQDVPFLMNQITNTIAKNITNPANIVLKGVKNFPNLKIKPEGDIVDIAMPLVAFLILHQLFPVFLSNLVYEKESKIRELMKMTGLKMWLYFIVHYITDYAMYLIVVSLMIIAGCIFQLRFFLVNNFGVYVILFILYGHVLIAQSFFLSVFFNSRKASTVFGYVCVVVTALISFVLIDNLLTDYENVFSSIKTGVTVFPFFGLYRALMYLSAEVSNRGTGYKIEYLNNKAVDIAQVYYMLVIEWAVLMVLWAYLEQVVPSQWGVAKHPLFFLGFGKNKNENTEHLESTMPDDVLAESNRVMNGSPKDFGIQIKKIKKVFPGVDKNPPKVAIKQLTFGVDRGQCVAILGHNGAGKTTLINTLIGLVQPTNGTAFIEGFDLISELPSIHTLMGVCQQFDILWENLTGDEILSFYAKIRGFTGKRLRETVHDALRKVNLYSFRNTQCGRYSGGMKRRLSVAVAFITYPKVIYLDEPSTGLDPKSRQELWAVINEVKQTSSVILTTHSMEEADRIADKIIIIADGEMQCIGVSAELKSRFGDGFKLAVQVAKHGDEEEVHRFIMSMCPTGTLVNALAGTRTYQMPKGALTLDVAFEKMENNKEKLKITDWAITNTTLEEVFLKISEDRHSANHSVKINQGTELP